LTVVFGKEGQSVPGSRLGEKMHAEDGLASAAGIIESLVNPPGQ
jgi:hypothetical protein